MKFKYLLLLFNLIISATNIMKSGEFNDKRMNFYDVLNYDLSLNFDFKQKKFDGIMKMQARIKIKTTQLVLSASNETLTIDSVFCENTKFPYTHESNHLVINLPGTFYYPSLLDMRIHYHGLSKFTGKFEDGGIYFGSDDRVATSSEPNFARMWWPCKDIPSNKATATVTISVPPNMTAVSNGALTLKRNKFNIMTYRWATKYPIATYLVSIAVAKYYEFSENYISPTGKQMEIFYYIFPEDSYKAKIDFKNTTKILDYFINTFGEYPFIDEKLGFAEVEGELTMENQTICSIQKSKLTGDRKYELTIAHEIAHHWFGDMITPIDWRHTWLNESFATYAEALYLEHESGHEAYQRYIDKMMSMKTGTYSGSVIGQSDTSFWDSFSPRQYYKGAIVLHMLRGLMGDSLFFTCLRNYCNNKHLQYRNAQTEDFIRECENVYGQNLKWFFDQWIYASVDSVDRPELDYDWSSVQEDSSYKILLSIGQNKASKILYRLPLDISISTINIIQTFKIIDSLATQSFNFSLPEKPTKLDIDRENRIFKTLKIKKHD